jgi:hypothetical protein
MNFKTTIVLIALLVVAGAVVLFMPGRDKSAEQGEGATLAKLQKVFDIEPGDVTRVSITAADGKKMVLEKEGAKWMMTEPVKAPAESFEADGLVRALANLEANGEVTGSTADAKATGIATPKYTVGITAGGGKDYTLLVGVKSAVGDNLYVAREDNKDKTLVVSASVLEQLR